MGVFYRHQQRRFWVNWWRKNSKCRQFNRRTLWSTLELKCGGTMIPWGHSSKYSWLIFWAEEWSINVKVREWIVILGGHQQFWAALQHPSRCSDASSAWGLDRAYSPPLYLWMERNPRTLISKGFLCFQTIDKIRNASPGVQISLLMVP